MAATSDMGVLLRFYASKQKSPFILYSAFIDYVKRYAARNVEEQEALVSYLGDPTAQLEKAFEPLIESKQIAIIDTNPAKKVIFVTGYFNAIFAERYKEIKSNATVPFPTIQDMPKQTPNEVLIKSEYTEIIFDLLKNQKPDDKNLYAIIVPMNLPSIIFPGNVPVSVLVNASLEKMQHMLEKDEYHDYYLKKLRISNPGKEISVKNFFSQFVKSPEEALQSLKNSADCFYFWGQLCYFIKQDYEKVKDFTQEDVNVLQAVAISEIVTSFYKNESAKNLQQENALKSVQNHLKQPPYFFTMDGILKFTDAKGVPLQGQYKDEALKEFLQKETTDAMANELPNLLVFKTSSGARYFIYKEKVFPLVVRMCNELHDTINDSITREWYEILKNYEKSKEMTDENAFNERLEHEVEKLSPILHSLLNATFLSVLNIEMARSNKGGGSANLFLGDNLLPYSHLLMLNRQTILANAKILLPFWYTIPIFSWLMSLFNKKPQKKKKQSHNVVAPVESEEIEERRPAKKSESRKDSLINAAKKVESNLVPEGSSIEREMNSYKKQWNKMITKQAYLNLTEDVNSLIRDYMRKVLRTISGQSFTIDRIQDLAETLCKTPNMQKITDQDSLYVYVQLYMVYLVKNL
ncbi:MAG: hypothetical protein K6A42_05210 [Treponema sp.]|nr:hypothetical protein [Treponema sp.]